MKLKKSISLLLLAVYLFATAGAAVASLSCECVSMKAHAAHVCCHHCQHMEDAATSPGGVMRAPCCGNHHSTDIELYTSSNAGNSEKYTRCVVLALPPTLSVECPCPAHIPFLREKVAEQRSPFVREACILPVGFRAPPVLA